MGNDRYARIGAASGLIFIVLFLVGFLAFVTPDAPDADAAGQDWTNYYSAHQNRIQFGILVVGVGVFFFIWFLGSLRSALARAEGGDRRLTSVAFGGGLIAVAFFVIAITATAAAAYRPQEAGANVTQALNDIAFVVGAPAAAAFTALFAATAIIGYRHNAFPAPVSGLSALAAVTQPLAYGIAFTDSGAFAPDGALGLFVPLITFVIAILTLSGALVSQPTPSAAGAPTTPGTPSTPGPQ